MIFSMPTLLELEPQVMTLQEHDRASLATTLLSSLPPALYDDDNGVTEALRREQEAESDPSVIISLNEFERGIAALRSR
jgi:hypothetical protein